MGKGTKNLALGAAIAAGVGYVVGLLTAPKSGKETRKDIENAAFTARREAERRLKDLHGELSVTLVHAEEILAEKKLATKAELAKAVKTATIARDKAREMLSALHEGDADDKELKQALVDGKAAITHLKKYIKHV